MPMPDEVPHVLLIEDNPGDARLVREALSGNGFAQWRLSHRQTAYEGIEFLAQQDVAAVLLDLTLPDCTGADTLARVQHAAPRMPIVVLTGLDDGALARDAVKG